MNTLTSKIIEDMMQLIQQEDHTFAEISLDNNDDQALWLLGLSDALESCLSIIPVFQVLTGDRGSEGSVLEKGFDVIVLIALATKALTATFYCSCSSDKKDSIRFWGEGCGYLFALSLCLKIEAGL